MNQNPIKIFTGLIFSDEKLCKKVETQLIKKFGPVEISSPVFNFDFTEYYKKEMGPNLKRKFLVFKQLQSAGFGCEAKRFTMFLEDHFREDNKRKVNIDPGYINLAKLVLLTRKDYSHRIELSEGIYAEVTLYYRNGTFNPWPWTYPDYKTKEYISFFNEVRLRIKQQLIQQH